MSKEKRSVPKLRFPGFTEDWEQRKFSEITYLSGIKNKENKPYESYSISNEFGFIPQNEQFEHGGTMKTADKSMYYIVTQNSFAYNPARINVGSIGYYDKPDNVIVSSLYEVFKTTEIVNDKFLWHWFKSNQFNHLIEKYQEGGVRLYFYYDKLCKGAIELPTIDEQNKISNLLNGLDLFITLHQRKLEHLNLKKKALLQKLFPKNGERYPELRFPGFTDAWEQRKLESLGKIITGNTPSTLKKEYWSTNSEGVVWITPTDINSVKTDWSERLLTEEGASQARIVPANSILVTCIASIGKNTINTVEAAFNQQINALVPHLSNSYFILTMLNNMESAFKRVAGTSATSIINKKEFGQLSALLPRVEEQNKIGEIFELIDKSITLHQRKLEHLQLQKKALLQQMFV